MRVSPMVEALMWMGAWCACFWAAARSDAANCTAGCKEVKAKHGSGGNYTYSAYSDGLQADMFQQAVDPERNASTAPTGKRVTLYTCEEGPEVCDNNPLDPSRELDEPDWNKCNFFGRVNQYDCLSVGS